MKKLVFTALLSGSLSTPAMAVSELDLEKCRVLGDMARMIMEYRQSGGLMTNLIAAVSTDPGSKDLLTSFIIDAYEQPSYTTDAVIQRVVTDFQVEAERLCLQAVMSD